MERNVLVPSFCRTLLSNARKRLLSSKRHLLLRMRTLVSCCVGPGEEPNEQELDIDRICDGTCVFQVEYLGCVEIPRNRGTDITDYAMQRLRNSRRRPVTAELHVSPDGFRVVDNATQEDIVDQSLPNISFAAIDTDHEKGFSYIHRDKTSRRWRCYGFLASKEPQERLVRAAVAAFDASRRRRLRRTNENHQRYCG